MGCDVHMHTEVKIEGEWHHYSTPNINRNYALFTRMAGVREVPDIEPIAAPRGVPRDATFITKFDYMRWGVDAHSASWLNAKELGELVDWFDEYQKSSRYARDFISWEHQELGYLFGNGWNISKYPEDYPKGVEDARVIFWFDN